MSAATLAAPSVPCSHPPGSEGRIEAREAERRLLIRYHADGDLRARDELVERLMPLARDLALRYAYTREPLDDLVQVASLGLIKAIDRFEPGRGTRFTTYAVPTILGELKRHFRDKGWALHVARGLQERATAVNRETEALSMRLGRSPKPQEVANALGLSVERLLADARVPPDAASPQAAGPGSSRHVGGRPSAYGFRTTLIAPSSFFWKIS